MTDSSERSSDGGYVTVQGRRVWHEVHGSSGEAMLLLHGGFAGASSWGAQIPALLEAGFQLYVPERRGHGHTPDVDGPFTYEVMAEDTAAYIKEVVGAPVHLVGWSDGAVVALHVAMQRADLVRRMILIGQYYNSDGRLPDSALLRLIHTPEGAKFLRSEYELDSPDGPEHFTVIYAKMLAMIDSEPEIDLSLLSEVKAPTLVVQGDRDEVLLTHSASVAAEFADGRLAVLPGSHALPMELPDVLNPLITSFLQQGAPAALWI